MRNFANVLRKTRWTVATLFQTDKYCHDDRGKHVCQSKEGHIGTLTSTSPLQGVKEGHQQVHQHGQVKGDAAPERHVPGAPVQDGLSWKTVDHSPLVVYRRQMQCSVCWTAVMCHIRGSQPTSRRSGGDKRVKHTVAEQRFTPLSFVAAGRVKVSFFLLHWRWKKGDNLFIDSLLTRPWITAQSGVVLKCHQGFSPTSKPKRNFVQILRKG